MTSIHELPTTINVIAHQARFVAFTRRKRPISPRTGRSEGWNRPESWCGLAEAERCAAALGGYVGVAPIDMVILDFDKAVRHGAEHPWVRHWLDEIGCDVVAPTSGTARHGYPTITIHDELRELLLVCKVFSKKTNP